ncbi:secretin N-terminal domain-containing protein [Vibrio nereis]|uniref:secretin N-terminal domain-containing protein n=1 Tax=Vibrio nereis TaxID=693 RepID=UPI00249503BF|nr:secretin N-terminal domain-containing protein [Vibrio nereis]
MDKLKTSRTLINTLILVAITGCTTVGNEDVDKNNYADFDLGPSPLAGKTETNEEAPLKSTLASKKEQANKEFSSVQVASLPEVSNNSVNTLNQIPKFPDESKQISVSVDEMSISDFIHYVYGDLLDLDYAISPDVERERAKVVLRLQQPVKPTELYNIAGNLLAENDVVTASKSNILYFQKKRRGDNNTQAIGIGERAQDVPEISGTIIQLVPYIYGSGNNIMRLLANLSNVKVSNQGEHKLLMLEGQRDEILRAMRLVKMLDAPGAKGRDIRFISMAHASSSEMKKVLESVLDKEGINVGNNGDVAIVPVERQNSLIIYATSGEIGRRVEKWARLFDKPEEGSKARFYIYRPKYSKAEDIHEALNQFIQPGAGAESYADNGSDSASTKKKTSDTIISDAAFKIAVDKVQNSLLIQASPKQYDELMSLMEKLDQLPPQVALDVAIAEFDISDNFSAGISKILYDSTKDNGKSSVLEITPTKGAISFSGLLDSASIDISLIGEKSKSRVLSRPYLVVQDGESASITAGKQVPIQVGSNTTDGGNTSTEIQYRSTGVSLSVTPTINADGLVALEINQSVSGSEPGPADLNPIITDRTLSTSVLVGNGQTAVLGGLIQNNDANKGNSVPFLSDIPLLGNLFKAKSDTFSRSELVIMITPKIMSSDSDLDAFSDSMRDVFTLKLGQEQEQPTVKTH